MAIHIIASHLGEGEPDAAGGSGATIYVMIILENKYSATKTTKSPLRGIGPAEASYFPS
jgi:hypothetical protein